MASQPGLIAASPTLTSTAFPTKPNSIVPSPHMIHSSEANAPAAAKPATFLSAHHPTHPPHLTSIASDSLRTSPVPKSPKVLASLSPRSLIPLTGVAARTSERSAHDGQERMQDRRQSPNPATSALDALLRPQSSVSRPQDAPRTTEATGEASAVAGNATNPPEPMQIDQKAQTSPMSLSSAGSFPDRAPTASAHSILATSPKLSHAPGESDRDVENVSRRSPEEDRPGSSDARPSNRAFTFPGNRLEALPQDDARHPLRGMSLPMPDPARTPRTPSGSKKHKCPYCATEFTRHHNLKSHLLTHSHEKPFVCSTCQQRFRRLHDLKRHTKLHTGERPHICPKCKRRFARGDALARHNKGHGGCAGRRSSVGSYGADEDNAQNAQDERDVVHGDAGSADGMDGVVYGDDSPKAGRIDDEGELARDGRRLSLPSIRAQDLPAGAVSHQATPSSGMRSFSPERAASTYPPAARYSAAAHPLERSAPLSKVLGGPNHAVSPGGPSSTRRPRGPDVGAAPSASSPGALDVFAPGGMTESPKPLSPGGAASHQLGANEGGVTRSRHASSLTQQFQHHHFGRHGTGSSASPMGLPPISGASQAPHLPSLAGLAPPDTRFTLPTQATGGAAAAAGHGAGQTAPAGYSQSTGAPPPSSALSHSTGTSLGGSASSHGHAGGEGSHYSHSGQPDEIWSYVRSLEERLNRLTDEVVSLREELANRQRRDGGGRA